DAVLRRDGSVGIRVKDERRRSVLIHALLARQTLRQFRIRVVAQKAVPRSLMRPRLDHRNDGITEDCEVRPTAGAIHRIGSARVARIETRACCHGEMTSGRKSHDADTSWNQTPLRRLRTESSARTL